MKGINAIIYDLEILLAVPPRRVGDAPVVLESGIEYCAGWHDHAHMGITVLGCYDYLEDRYRVFCDDNKDEFKLLVANRVPLCVGFNNIPFDNQVLVHTPGWHSPNDTMCYDLLRQTWEAAGLRPTFASATHGGFGLDAMCETNFGTKKSGNGALAPVDWQQGRTGKVIDYCLNDVRLTKQLFDAVLAGAWIKNPKNKEPMRLMMPNVK